MIEKLLLWIGSIAAAFAVFLRWKSGIVSKVKQDAYIADQELKIKEFLEKSENAKKIERANSAIDPVGIADRLRKKWQRD